VKAQLPPSRNRRALPIFEFAASLSSSRKAVTIPRRATIAVLRLGLGLLLVTPSRTARAQASPDSASRVVLVGVTVFDGTGHPVRPNQSVVIQGERIAAIFPAGSHPLLAGATIYNLTGRYLIPGLIDTHVHVATDPSGEDSRVRTERRLRMALLGGVTAVRDMAGDVRALASLQRDALLGEIASPDIYYAALFAGPLFFADPRTHDASRGLIPGQVPWMRAITDTTDIHQAVAEARGTGATAIKLYAALSGALARRVTTEAHAQGLKVWAHAALRPAQPIDVVEAGVDAVSHANLVALAMDSARRATALHAPPNEPLDIEDAGLDTLLSTLVRRHTIFEPTLLIFADRPPALRLAGAIAGRAHRRGVTIIAGTDTLGMADSDSLILPNLHRELELLVTLAGLSPAEALESATREAAAVLGAQGIRGTIEVGKLADLVVLRADPILEIRNTRSIQLVMKRGRVYRN
jgi:imidazolonepropionase-like amidohydrolase